MLLRETEQVGGAAVARRRISEPKKVEENIHSGMAGSLAWRNQPAPGEKVSTPENQSPSRKGGHLCGEGGRWG